MDHVVVEATAEKVRVTFMLNIEAVERPPEFVELILGVPGRGTSAPHHFGVSYHRARQPTAWIFDDNTAMQAACKSTLVQEFDTSVVAHYLHADFQLGSGKKMSGRLVIDGHKIQKDVAVTLFDGR